MTLPLPVHLLLAMSYVIAFGPAVAVLVTWYTSGLGYLMSVTLAPQNSMVAAVAVCMIVGGFLNGVEPRYRTLTTPMKHVFGEQLSCLHEACHWEAIVMHHEASV